jgi:SagB-type dehydrogenase family enzyme
VSSNDTDQRREILKDNIRLKTDFSRTDQSRGVPPPPVQKPYPEDAELIELPKPGDWKGISGVDLIAAIGSRKSHRAYKNQALNLEELSFLLWATQGIRRVMSPAAALRTVPSAGARHAFETYLCVTAIDGLASGIYRFLPIEHKLLPIRTDDHLPAKISEATLGQSFTGSAPVTFVWTAIPYRMEWRYGPASYKVIALDAGHVGQNLYLACEAIGAGTCAIAAYHQALMDQLLEVDGRNEFTVYLAPVGKI